MLLAQNSPLLFPKTTSIRFCQPYSAIQKYKRVAGKLMLVERGIYETENYGWNNNEIVLEKFDNHVVPNECKNGE